MKKKTIISQPACPPISLGGLQEEVKLARRAVMTAGTVMRNAKIASDRARAKSISTCESYAAAESKLAHAKEALLEGAQTVASNI